MNFSINANNEIILEQAGQKEGAGGDPEDLSDKRSIIRIS
jgi:hypothetical protein